MTKLKALTRNEDSSEFSAPSAFRRQRVASEDGAVLVEMALACILLLTILFGLMEMSLGLYTYNAVSNAARQGSRWAIVRGSACNANTPNQCGTASTASVGAAGATQSNIQNYVAGLGYLNMTASDVTVSWLKAATSGTPATTTWSACSTGTCNAPGNEVQVTVTYPFPLSIPLVPKSTLNLASTSTLVISQ
jgi:Flp pilus assembly protein TadG